MTFLQTNKEGQYWLALSKLSAKLRKTSREVPDGDALLREILDPLKPANGYEGSAHFVSGARKASTLWEMVVTHIEIIKEALQGCAASTQM